MNTNVFRVVGVAGLAVIGLLGVNANPVSGQPVDITVDPGSVGGDTGLPPIPVPPVHIGVPPEGGLPVPTDGLPIPSGADGLPVPVPGAGSGGLPVPTDGLPIPTDGLPVPTDPGAALALVAPIATGVVGGVTGVVDAAAPDAVTVSPTICGNAVGVLGSATSTCPDGTAAVTASRAGATGDHGATEAVTLASDGAAAQSGSLPITGSDIVGIVVAGLGMVIAGATLVLGRRFAAGG